MIIILVIVMVVQAKKPTKQMMDIGTEIKKGEFTLTICQPFIKRKGICEPDVPDLKYCAPMVEKICTPSVIFGKIPGLCGIVCEVQCMVVDVGEIVREEMTKYSEKNMAQYTSIRKEIDAKTDAILKEVKARR